MKINIPDEINILGYSGSILALYFDILKCHEFKGKVNIIKNDDRSDLEPFNSGIEYQISNINEFNFKENSGEYLLCSNKPGTKSFLLEAFKDKIPHLRLNLMTLIHPTAYIGSGAIIGKGSVIEALACIAPFANLGSGVFISRTSTVGHHTNIGDWSSINPGVTLTGKINIGESVTIGPGATVFAEVSIGNNSIIGGGSVVTKDIPEGVLAYGNPCQVVKKIQ